MVAAIAIPGGTAAAAAGSYSTSAEFSTGVSINVVTVGDAVKLDDTTKPFGFVWIAASARGTIVKIDATTGEVLGEYQSAPDLRGRNPSRTTVDANGNVWATNRDESEGGRGSVVHIGLAENNQCVDRNGNGAIDTSTGLGDIRPWANTGGADNFGGVSTAADECILHYTRVTGMWTRHVSLDAANNVWVGGLDRDFELVDGATGIAIPGTQFNAGCGGYGGLTDQNGVVWSTSSGPILRYDPLLGTGLGGAECLYSVPGAYGMAIDPNTGHIWVSELGGTERVHEIDPITKAVLNSYPQGFGAQGLVVDRNSHVWVAEIFGTRVAHFAPDMANPGKHVLVGYVSGFGGTTGVAVDHNGKIWASEMSTSSAARVDPQAGPITPSGYPLGAIEATVPLGMGASPYNYSDMTGSTIIAPPGSGSWSVVYDSGVPNAQWGTVSWNAITPGDSAVTVTAATSQDGSAFGPTVAVPNGADLSIADGRYLRITVALNRATTGETPVLSDVTVAVAEEQVPAGVTLTLAYGGDGTGSVTGAAGGVPFAWDGCNATGCTKVFPGLAYVTVTQTPDANMLFKGWGIQCAGTGATCSFKMNANKKVVAMFGPTHYPMTVTTAGTGVGSVTSDVVGGAAIACASGSPAGCSGSFPSGSTVTLTASWDTTSNIFKYWSGGPCSGTAPSCVVTMNDVKGVTATFAPATFPLSVTVNGAGRGTVTGPGANGAAISCTTGSVVGCSAPEPNGEMVTLTATPTDADSVLAAWSGCKSVSGNTCTVQMVSAKSVAATFQPARYPLSVTLRGTGKGTVAGTAAGSPIPFVCSATACNATVANGASVALTASAQLGSRFTGWGVVCTGTGTCSFKMNSAKSPVATFSSP